MYDEWDIEEYKPYMRSRRLNNARYEDIGTAYNHYKKELEKTKLMNLFCRTLTEIQSLPEIKTGFGD